MSTSKYNKNISKTIVIFTNKPQIFLNINRNLVLKYIEVKLITQGLGQIRNHRMFTLHIKGQDHLRSFKLLREDIKLGPNVHILGCSFEL